MRGASRFIGNPLMWWQRRNRRDIKGTGHSIEHRDARLSSVVFNVRGTGHRIIIEPGCHIVGVTFHIRGSGHLIRIGRDCRFNRGGTIWFEDTGGRLEIGEGTTIEAAGFGVTENGSAIRIGRDCMFSTDIDVRTGDSHAILDGRSGDRINPARDVTIGDHVWVGARSVILKGVTLPSNSIVATGAIVTRAFDQEGILIGGNPARLIKEGVTWRRERD